MNQPFPIHGGELRANKIGSFIMGGEQFHVIRPGYDCQGKRRTRWVQIVHEDIPIFESKVRNELPEVIEQFESNWKRTIGDDRDLLQRALAACKKERRRKFRDGESGVSPAPALTRDGTGEGREYPT